MKIKRFYRNSFSNCNPFSMKWGTVIYYRRKGVQKKTKRFPFQLNFFHKENASLFRKFFIKLNLKNEKSKEFPFTRLFFPIFKCIQDSLCAFCSSTNSYLNETFCCCPNSISGVEYCVQYIFIYSQILF